MFSIYAIVCVKFFALTKQEESAVWLASCKIIAQQLSAAGHLATSISQSILISLIKIKNLDRLSKYLSRF